MMKDRKETDRHLVKEKLQMILGILSILVLVIGGEYKTVLAQEDIEMPVNVQLMTADVMTEVKEKPEPDARTLMTYQENDSVMVIGEEKEWYQVKYQDMIGYVPKADLVPMEMDVETLNQQFSQEEEEGKLVVETVEYYRVQHKRTIIWGTVITVLVIGIFATGIVSAVRRGKKELTGAGEKDSL